MKCYAFMWEDPLYVSNVLHHKISAYIILLLLCTITSLGTI